MQKLLKSKLLSSRRENPDTLGYGQSAAGFERAGWGQTPQGAEHLYTLPKSTGDEGMSKGCSLPCRTDPPEIR